MVLTVYRRNPNGRINSGIVFLIRNGRRLSITPWITPGSPAGNWRSNSPTNIGISSLSPVYTAFLRPQGSLPHRYMPFRLLPMSTSTRRHGSMSYGKPTSHFSKSLDGDGTTCPPSWMITPERFLPGNSVLR